jgi:LL-diaminopimelate aminotransferase
MRIELSERLKQLPPYLFVEIDKAKRAAVEKGQDVIDLGIGDPDIPTPKYINRRALQGRSGPEDT